MHCSATDRLSRPREPALPDRDPDRRPTWHCIIHLVQGQCFLVTTVGEIATASGRSSLTVHRIGRDRVARFAIGDWVCVTDDHRDLHGEAGEMAQIEDIDEANAIFRLDRTIGATGRPFATAPADLLARHTRVRKWDQSSSDPLVGADGTIPTATGPVAIEEGIEVSFSTVGSEGFHVGDYWLFSARTADASVEEFTAAPPRGIIHSYVQLAAVNGPDVSDCRPQPETSQGCCTFVLNPGDDIQLAIDQLPASGDVSASGPASTGFVHHSSSAAMMSVSMAKAQEQSSRPAKGHS